MNQYVYTEGNRVIGKGFTSLSGCSCHEVSSADFNRIDTELIETGLYLYENGILTEDSEILRILTASAVRAKRDRLLTDCDWTQLADSPLTAEEKSRWAAYRQSLRDVPQQEGFPSSVCFPEKP